MEVPFGHDASAPPAAKPPRLLPQNLHTVCVLTLPLPLYP